MLIAFRSKADADVLMLWGPAQEVLNALGRLPAPEGIFLPEHIGAALQALELALQQPPIEADAGTDSQDDDTLVTLRRRAWPVKSQLERALAMKVPVLWGPA
ncbi:hypothetical protein HNQ51_003557 [Inhella inkyongensis]|uniref:DUF1840 domain-containing protein n=1 Tax=Inhella inkyongensis TaxID=392593 RepID=A0A840S9C2_9BURK|nr:DUF1840 family protein [Inhella inkyongensis]MBB5206212.1 hypothetical protein [Inhella inkyongensis]